MYKILSYAIIAFATMAITACDEVEGITVEEIEVPEGYELSAGTSTIFFNSPLAYDQPADWIADAYDSRFNSGDRLYDNVKTINENGNNGGLGPVYAGFSCGSCHRNAGRTEPTYWSALRNGSDMASGDYGFTSMLIYITKKNLKS